MDSNYAPLGQNGGDIEKGESQFVQAKAELPGPQAQNGDIEKGYVKETNGPHMSTQSPQAEAEHSSSPSSQAANESPPTSPSSPQTPKIQLLRTQSSPPTSSSSPQSLEIQPSSPQEPEIQPSESDPQTQAAQAQPPQRALYEENRKLSVKLYKAALNGDWETLESELGDNPREILCANITKHDETVLHIAAGARQTKFVEKLMKSIKPEDLELQDKNGNTAFCLAAAAGAKSIAEIMIKERQNLPEVRNNLKETPLYKAAVYGQGDMVRFLYPETEYFRNMETEIQIPNQRTDLFFTCIDIGLFDLALTLLKRDSRLAVICNGERGTALHMLARKPSAFHIKSPGIWKTFINSFVMSKDKRKLNQTDDALKLVTCLWKNVIKDEGQGKVRDDKEIIKIISEPSGLLFDAAELGNFKFLAELVCLYPDLIWELNRKGRSIFHIAVLHRHVSIFNQIHNIGSIKDCLAKLEDKSQNNMLHLAAKLPCQSQLNEVSGAALQMQQELIWFQEVEKMVQPSYRERKNSRGLRPRELFTMKHKGLLKDGELWMRDRADSCMLVATLITTVVFAAAFTLPGGIDNSAKLPNLLAKNWFQVFTMSDAIAFSSSLFSIMIFLSLLTSRYTEKDFLSSLPYKLMAGLLTLFISMIAMMAAFTAAFILAYDQEKRWAPILISATAFLPAGVFVCLQFSLFFDVFKSTFFSKSLFRPSKPMIC